ncbi:hypothetical protein B434_00315 [Mycoplasmoides pneumoniae 19294]|nr:conserved hypothetical protein [Mycoplasmoides pneumoniae FH]AGC04362.2 hypothetical protein C985_0477 [Mycoplasmoides pneumoniae M129-B7]ALA30342.1 hypothetical protein C897_02690 [Mycoplasmoides pneumoniae PI 1428]ALA30630.1 hypothetical protein B434_00315 [Mycoplasmoides pneumoniae 19294]ALA32447.1 hypothetical protein F533_02685 [Mycoplasmoides pneumoniae 51494]ALA33148.1 hypothetical protein F530_02690 [Mycoplasmoides pneumoniae 54089]ALA33853.1 hypothetical protein F531_02690 [Mycopl
MPSKTNKKKNVASGGGWMSKINDKLTEINTVEYEVASKHSQYLFYSRFGLLDTAAYFLFLLSFFVTAVMFLVGIFHTEQFTLNDQNQGISGFYLFWNVKKPADIFNANFVYSISSFGIAILALGLFSLFLMIFLGYRWAISLFIKSQITKWERVIFSTGFYFSVVAYCFWIALMLLFLVLSDQHFFPRTTTQLKSNPNLSLFFRISHKDNVFSSRLNQLGAFATALCITLVVYELPFLGLFAFNWNKQRAKAIFCRKRKQ